MTWGSVKGCQRCGLRRVYRLDRGLLCPACRDVAPPGSDLSWHDRAACRDHPTPEDFYADSREQAAVDRAIAVCRSCKVAPECLADADARRDYDGIWGGLTGPERLRFRKARA